MNKYSFPTLSQFLEETDVEKLRYMLGGYRHTADTHIQNHQLYPLCNHTKHLLADCDSFLASVHAIDNIIPKEIIGIKQDYSIERRQLEYDDIVDKQYIKTVSVKKHATNINSYVTIAYENIAAMLQWEFIGLESCFPSTGFVFTQYKHDSYVDTYQFTIADMVREDGEKIVEIMHKETWRYSFVNTFLTKKHEYIYEMSHLASLPACLLVTCPPQLPKQYTLLPLIKELLPKQLQSHV